VVGIAEWMILPPKGGTTNSFSHEKTMLLHIPDILTAEQVAHCSQKLDQADWVDGRITAGHQSARAKYNMQLP
jgi:hypothetical protein